MKASEQSIKEDEETWESQQDFSDYNRETAKVLPPKVRIANFNEFRTPLGERKNGAASGSSLHGLRRSFLSVRNDAWWLEWRQAVRCTILYRRQMIWCIQETGNRHI